MADSFEIAPAHIREIDAAAALASHAMIGLPENEVVFRGRRDRMESSFRMLFRDAPQYVHVAREGERLLGVLRLVPWPECRPDLSRNFVLLPRMALSLGTTLPRAARMQMAWKRKDPQKRHLHLDPLAVSPDAQGKGVGSALMRYCCERLERDQMPGYLETGRESSVRFYEKFGFRVTGEIGIMGTRIWLMWREPGSS